MKGVGAAGDLNHGRGNRDEVRQRADNIVSAAAEDGGRDLGQRDCFVLHAHEPPIGGIERAVDGDFNAMFTDQGDERAHAAPPSAASAAAIAFASTSL